MKHQLKLSRGASALCSSILSVPGLLKDTKQIWWAGFLLSVIPSYSPPTEQGGFAAWADSAGCDMEITEGQRDTIKTAFNKAVENGSVIPSKYANELMLIIGLSPE